LASLPNQRHNDPVVPGKRRCKSAPRHFAEKNSGIPVEKSGDLGIIQYTEREKETCSTCHHYCYPPVIRSLANLEALWVDSREFREKTLLCLGRKRVFLLDKEHQNDK